MICKDNTALTTYFYIVRAELSQLIPFFTPCTIEEGHLYATGYMEGKTAEEVRTTVLFMHIKA